MANKQGIITWRKFLIKQFGLDNGQDRIITIALKAKDTHKAFKLFEKIINLAKENKDISAETINKLLSFLHNPETLEEERIRTRIVDTTKECGHKVLKHFKKNKDYQLLFQDDEFECFIFDSIFTFLMLQEKTGNKTRNEIVQFFYKDISVFDSIFFPDNNKRHYKKSVITGFIAQALGQRFGRKKLLLNKNDDLFQAVKNSLKHLKDYDASEEYMKEINEDHKKMMS